MQINSLLDMSTLLLQYLQGYLANRGRVSGNVGRKVEARVLSTEMPEVISGNGCSLLTKGHIFFKKGMSLFKRAQSKS